MDGTKLITDIINFCNKQNVVDRRFIRNKAFSQERVNLIKMKILAVVRSNLGENPNYRKGKGSLAM